MIVLPSKKSVIQAAQYFYDYHVNQILKLPASYASATPSERDQITYHEKAAKVYLETLQKLV